MKPTAKVICALGALAILAGCVSMPSGPSVMVLPGSGKSFEQFRADDLDCRQYAHYQLGGSTPSGSATQSAVTSAAIGTAIGAAAGAALGGHNDAAAGAAFGLLTGSMIGASNAGLSQYEVQRRYDNAFQQCMYARGHKVPVAGYVGGPNRGTSSYTPPPPPPSRSDIPPPPAGAPPPPPPGVK